MGGHLACGFLRVAMKPYLWKGLLAVITEYKYLPSIAVSNDSGHTSGAVVVLDVVPGRGPCVVASEQGTSSEMVSILLIVCSLKELIPCCLSPNCSTAVPTVYKMNMSLTVACAFRFDG